MRNVIKSFFKNGYVGLFAALLSCCVGIEGKRRSDALPNAPLQLQPSAPVRPSFQQASATSADAYVQSEAHMQLDEVKEKMEKFTMPDRSLSPNEMVTPYLHIVAAVINKEVQFKNSHYAFYQATNNEWRVPQDLFKKLYIQYKKPGSALNDFTFVRFGGGKNIKAQDFLRSSLEKFGGVNDTIPALKDLLISVNVDLFGNVGLPQECTWNYFLRAQSHREPIPQNFDEILNAFDLTYDREALAAEAKELVAMLVKGSPEQTLLQFLIPQNKVDDMAYISWTLGVPAHKETIQLMEHFAEGGKGKRGKGHLGGIAAVTKKFKKEKNNPIYKDLLAAIEKGDLGVSGFMETLRNDPFSLKNLNSTQGRILVTDDLVNPASGIKIFSYFTTPHTIQQQYMQKLDALVAKIIAQENSKSPQQKAAEREKNQAAMMRLNAPKKAK